MRIALLAVALALAAPAAAQPWDEKGKRDARFLERDLNKDGYISRAEAAGERELAKRFSRFDANRDGRLSEPEYLKAREDQDYQYVTDSALTTKVKAALLVEKGIASSAISVSSYEGRVQLSGFVESADQAARAGRAAARVSGVKRVQNNLEVK